MTEGLPLTAPDDAKPTATDNNSERRKSSSRYTWKRRSAETIPARAAAAKSISIAMVRMSKIKNLRE